MLEFHDLRQTTWMEIRKKSVMSFEQEKFWEMVEGRRFFGLKFRTLHRLRSSPLVVPFYCHKLKLVVQIKSEITVADQWFYDWTLKRGYSVRGFSNFDEFRIKRSIKELVPGEYFDEQPISG